MAIADSRNPAGFRLPNRRADIRQQAVQLSAGHTTETTDRLISQLNSLDFVHSALPRKILEDRQDPAFPYCKLEYAAKGFVQMLKRHRGSIQWDIQPLDEKLMTLIILFRQAVDHGDATTAHMAKSALYHGIVDIRCRFPQNPAVSKEEFVSVNADYLEQWINLVQWAQIYDQQARDLAGKRKTHQNDENRLNESIEQIRRRIGTDPAYGDAFLHILNHDAPAERARWTAPQREIHLAMVDHRMNQLTLQLSNLSLTALESRQIATRQKIDTLWKQLEDIPIVTDPNLMNKYRESMDKFIHDLAASDVFLEESLRQAEELEGAFQQLEQTSGALRQHQAAAAAAQQRLRELQTESRQRSENHN